MVVALHAVIYTMLARMDEFGSVMTGKKAYSEALLDMRNVYPVLDQVTYGDVVSWRQKMQRAGKLPKWNAGEVDQHVKERKE